MANYQIPFVLTVHGFMSIEAKSKKEAFKLVVDGEGEQFDNKSEFEFDEKKISLIEE